MKAYKSLCILILLSFHVEAKHVNFEAEGLNKEGSEPVISKLFGKSDVIVLEDIAVQSDDQTKVIDYESHKVFKRFQYNTFVLGAGCASGSGRFGSNCQNVD